MVRMFSLEMLHLLFPAFMEYTYYFSQIQTYSGIILMTPVVKIHTFRDCIYQTENIS